MVSSRPKKGELTVPQDHVASAIAFLESNAFPRHVKNLKSLSPNDLVLNHFSASYAAGTIGGVPLTANSLARALVIPRALGSSLSTIVSRQLRFFCGELPGVEVVGKHANQVNYTDRVDDTNRIGIFAGGPSNLNSPGRKTLEGKLTRLHAQIGRSAPAPVVCVTHGEISNLNSSFKKLDPKYAVFVGGDFWHRVTGDPNFYRELSFRLSWSAAAAGSKVALSDAIKRVEREIVKSRDIRVSPT